MANPPTTPPKTRRDAGASTLGNLVFLAVVVILVSGIYLLMDVRHRMAGYDAVHGKGIAGTVSVTRCEATDWRTYCVGSFTSTDGQVVRNNIRVNGAARLMRWNGVPLTAPVELPAVITGAKADQAWTANGVPWLEFSRGQLIGLAPIAIAAALLWRLLSGRGPMDRTSRKESEKQRAIRRGRVY